MFSLKLEKMNKFEEGVGQCEQIWRNFYHFLTVYFVHNFAKISIYFGKKYANGQTFIVVNMQRLKTNLDIWSH